LVKNGNFGQKSKFWSTIKNLSRNRNVGKKSKFWSIIEILVKNQKSKFWSNSEISPRIKVLVKHRNFAQKKRRNLVQNSKFSPKVGLRIIILVKKFFATISKLYHYRVAISPKTNFKFKDHLQTRIALDGKSYTFGGFSLLSHRNLTSIPDVPITRYHNDHRITLLPESAPSQSYQKTPSFLYSKFCTPKVFTPVF